MLHEAFILKNTLQGSPDHRIYQMVLRTPIAYEAQPGQFVHIKVRDGLDPLLRRPLSISVIDRERGTVTVCYRVQGKGTRYLAQAKAGDRLDVLGPLGRGFTLTGKNRSGQANGELWLVAGGIGIFPLFALAAEAKRSAFPVKLYWGGETAAFFQSAGLELWQELGIDCVLTTVDGSVGIRGMVTEALFRDLEDLRQGGWEERCGDNNGRYKGENTGRDLLKRVKVVACGPTPMLKAVAEFCRDRGIACEVSLEERMACGVGACLGCSCLLKSAGGTLKRARVCKDGPVFNGEEVVWDELKSMQNR